MSTIEIEKRLTAIEHELAHLKNAGLPAAQTHPIQTLERIHGTFENDDAFKEAMRLGRKWRKEQNSPSRKAKRT